jgi:hypothetical protein
MRDIVGHVVRRGVRAASDFRINGDKPEMPDIPAWGQAILVLTVIAFAGLLMAVQYTLTDVIGTLTMVETPAHAMVLVEDDPIKKPNDSSDPLLIETLVPMKPITSKIRTTIKHITSIGGRWARWRAIVPAMLYSVFFGVVSGIFSSILRFIPGGEILAKAAAAVVLARVHMAWTHAVISMPSSLRWYQRLAPFSSMKQLWVPTAVNVLAGYVAVFLVAGAAYLMGMCNSKALKKLDGQEIPKSMYAIFAVQATALLVVSLAMVLFVCLPAAVTLARVEASMLAEDQETIVPFDRSFGGKVVPRILGGTGAIGFLDAWRTFNWEARRRLIKLYLKSFLVIVALFFVLMHVVAFEAWVIMGPELSKTISKWKHAHKGHH